MYILRTYLLENPEVVFYYKGTAKEWGVPFALNTIMAFEPSDAYIFIDEQEAKVVISRLNLDKLLLYKYGYSEFKLEIAKPPL